ncbi:MAG: HPr(Ser) kinase/phosphatase [Clostridiaceae bacterium]|nr:HPr(Ser) kinase/phosphatase [Clostridiaceae bacterium]
MNNPLYDNNNYPFYVTLHQVVEEFHLEPIINYEQNRSKKVFSADVNRPGLQIIGFFDYFDNTRLQIIGKVETTYLSNMTSEQRYISFEMLFSKNIPAVIVTRGLDIFPEMIEAAKKYNTPVLRTQDTTSRFMSALIGYLNVCLAPRVTQHGVLVEVYGEGVLILAESGVGKSETAIELVKRGHRLVADDAVEIKKVSEKTLVGSAPEIIRHFIEIRGIGIIDVKKIFGMGAVKDSERIDMIIHLELWQEDKHYDRLGLVDEYTNLLGIDVPSLTIPVRPGRNLAVIVEVAAMNNRQKKMGYNAAEELNQRLMEEINRRSI